MLLRLFWLACSAKTQILLGLCSFARPFGINAGSFACPNTSGTRVQVCSSWFNTISAGPGLRSKLHRVGITSQHNRGAAGRKSRIVSMPIRIRNKNINSNKNNNIVTIKIMMIILIPT